jgi:hypothetical protein
MVGFVTKWMRWAYLSSKPIQVNHLSLHFLFVFGREKTFQYERRIGKKDG